jgi:hypothetical protein
MKELEAKFTLNGLPYTLLKRNDVVALYGIGGTYTEEILHYEVSKIHVRNDQYGLRESLPSNERFGRDGSSCFNDLESANRYFDELTTRLNLSQRGPRFMSGVQDNVLVISEYHFVSSVYP